MALVEINWNPSRRELKQFGLLWVGFFGLIGAYCLWFQDSRPAAATFWVIAAAGLAGFFAPGALRPVYVLWMAVALPIGWVISHLVLLATYYLVFTPVGLLMRLVGYDPLNRHIDRVAKSYWTPHDSDVEAARYFKQY
jgi:hypothetical protein